MPLLSVFLDLLALEVKILEELFCSSEETDGVAYDITRFHNAETKEFGIEVGNYIIVKWLQRLSKALMKIRKLVE